jgi:hypothetical protein
MDPQDSKATTKVKVESQLPQVGLKSRSVYKREISRKWIAEGRCSNCGSEFLVPDTKQCQNCLDNSKEGTGRYRKKNPDKFRIQYHEAKKLGYCVSCRVPGKPRSRGLLCCDCSLTERQRAVRVKYKAMQKYGGKCSCCGEEQIAFLTIDHINNDGAERRKEVGFRAGGGFYKKLLNLPLDPTLQVMCYNCNCGRRSTGVCPHKDSSFYEAALLKQPYERHK